jgi:cytochrome c oxidase assembly factor CtaG/ferredoxin
LGLLASLIVYLRGWFILHRSSPKRFPVWRALAFTGGLLSFWLAIASPLDAFSGFLLSAHMVQHLLLMSVAPPLILLGTPLLPLLRGLPRKFTRDGLGPFLVWPTLRRFGHALTHPVNCWILMAVTLFAWHVPAAFDLTLRSPAWHKLEHACFFGAALLFWWPVVRPFPSRPHWPLWSVPVYLLAADLLNTSLSAILTFSDHVLYTYYLGMPRLFGTTALTDQSSAGVIMWVPGSLAFLIPAAMTAIEFLSPRHLLVRPQPISLQKQTKVTKRTLMLPGHTAFWRAITSLLPQPLINTPLQRGVAKPNVLENRFNGFGGVSETVKTVSSSEVTVLTPLKRGVNESRWFDLLSVPLLGPLLRAQTGRRLLQTLMLILALAVIADGLVGPQVSSANLAGVLPWTYWRAFVIIALLAAGNFFCMACPFTLFRELGRRLGLRQRPWPRALRSKWLAVVLLVLFFWAYEAFNLWDKPIWTAWLIINYFLIAFAIDALFSGASFCKYVCPIGQFQFVASLVSPLEVKVREPSVCTSCKTHDCLRGNAQQRGCEMNLYLPRKSGNLDCTFCLDCVRACPHDNVGIMATAPGLEVVRDPQRASIGRLSSRSDIAALGLVFVFAAFVNAAMMVAPISNWRDRFAARLNLTSILPATSIFFFTLVLTAAILVGASVLAGKAIARIKAPTRELLRRFALALVPLAVAMWAAHFLFHFLIGWKSVWPVFLRFMGDWGLAVANQKAFSGFGLENVHVVQTLLLDIGLLGTLYLGWRIARLYAPRFRQALRIMAPWSGVAVALYVFGVWTCLQPMQMRGLASMLP